MTGQDQVEQVLSEYPRARQDDKYLQLKVWSLQGLRLDARQFMHFLSKSVSSPESIRRTRQKLQEQHRYLPENQAVAKARKARAKAIRQTIVHKQEVMTLFEED